MVVCLKDTVVFIALLLKLHILLLKQTPVTTVIDNCDIPGIEMDGHREARN